MYTLLGKERCERHVWSIFTFENRVLKNKNSMLLHSFPRLYFQMLRILVFFSVSAGKKMCKEKINYRNYRNCYSLRVYLSVLLISRTSFLQKHRKKGVNRQQFSLEKILESKVWKIQKRSRRSFSFNSCSDWSASLQRCLTNKIFKRFRNVQGIFQSTSL